jgi:hypothetical protein
MPAALAVVLPPVPIPDGGPCPPPGPCLPGIGPLLERVLELPEVPADLIDHVRSNPERGDAPDAVAEVVLHPLRVEHVE